MIDIDGASALPDFGAMGLRRLDIDIGGFQATKLGAPPAISDLYYSTMEMHWPSFIGLIAGVFIVLNVFFGLLYAALPGAIAGMAPGSVGDGFFFSVETLATVGYGNMAPASGLGHSIAAIEILTGIFFSSTVTGLIFARFARPRNSLVFSRVAVLNEFEGQRALIVRVASTRSRPLADVSAQMAWLEQTDLPDGRFIRRLVNLPLVRAQNPLLALSWTLIHIAEPGSPMLEALAGNRRFQLTVSVSGLDTLLASQSTGARSYRREDVMIDHDFVDVISDTEGRIALDLTKLHDTRPIAA